MDKNESAIFSCFGVLLLAFGGIIGGAIMNGWVLSILWSWFVIPIFGVPTLSIPLAIGFSLTVGMLAGKNSAPKNEKKSTTEVAGELIGAAFLTPLFVLFLGYIIKMFIQYKIGILVPKSAHFWADFDL